MDVFLIADFTGVREKVLDPVYQLLDEPLLGVVPKVSSKIWAIEVD